MRKRTLMKVIAVSALSTMVMTSCNLIPKEEEEYKVQIVKENVSESYALAVAEYGDVELVKNISCTYSQLNEAELKFEIGGRKVANVYVQEGEEVTEGQMLARLDVSSLESQNVTLAETIEQDTLMIKNEREMIDFYDKRINLASTGLKAKEEYTLSKQECNERILKYENEIDYANNKIAENEIIISKAAIYSPMDGTVSFLHEDIVGWQATTSSVAIKVIDTGVCAFVAKDAEELQQYVSVGDSFVISLSGGNTYNSTCTSISVEDNKIVFELDEPDFSIAVGTRGTISIELGYKTQVLRLPRNTVYGDENMYYVYALSDSGVREMVVIEAGLVGNNYVEILGGIEVNSSVILRSK